MSQVPVDRASPQIPLWMEVRKTGTLIRLFIQPKASKSEFAGLHEGATGELPRLKIRVAAPPVEGEANEELLRFLKKTFRITGARFTLERGETSRQKDVFCENIFPKDFERVEKLCCLL
jgi:hypothetical protein